MSKAVMASYVDLQGIAYFPGTFACLRVKLHSNGRLLVATYGNGGMWWVDPEDGRVTPVADDERRRLYMNWMRDMRKPVA